jgi:hypothetical protein
MCKYIHTQNNGQNLIVSEKMEVTEKNEKYRKMEVTENWNFPIMEQTEK